MGRRVHVHLSAGATPSWRNRLNCSFSSSLSFSSLYFSLSFFLPLALALSVSTRIPACSFNQNSLRFLTIPSLAFLAFLPPSFQDSPRRFSGLNISSAPGCTGFFPSSLILAHLPAKSQSRAGCKMAALDGDSPAFVTDRSQNFITSSMVRNGPGFFATLPHCWLTLQYLWMAMFQSAQHLDIHFFMANKENWDG